MVFSFLNKYRVAAIAALFMMLIELTVELTQPLIISKIIDNGIQTGDQRVVWMWGGILLGSAGVAFAAGILSSFLAAHASQGFGYDLRDRLYERVQGFTYEKFSRFASSSLITRLTGDVTQLQEMVFMGLRFMSRVPLVVAGSVIMAMVVHLRLGILLTVTVPLLIVFLYWMMKKAVRLFREVQQRLDNVNGVVQENLTGIRLIRVFVRMGHEIGRFTSAGKALMERTVSAMRLTEISMPFVLFVMNMAIIAILWFGRIEIADGGATLGQTVAVVNYALRAIGAMSALSWLVVAFSRARASAQRVNEVLAAEDGSDGEEASGNGDRANTKKAPAITGDVLFDNVSFRYAGSDIEVLQQISFKAKAGDVVAIMGATGSGKSSLVSLLPRLYEPTGGRIVVDGRDIAAIDPFQLRGAIGYVPQEVLLFSGTVRDNIAWGNRAASMEDIRQAAAAAQIHETIESLADGYDTMLGQRGVNLSGGQKQRLSIARALVRKPAILILDDSTSALDAVTESRLLDALKGMSCTTFLITQKISSTAEADLVVLLDEGRLIGAGSHEELLRENRLYRMIDQSQKGEGELAKSVT